MKIEDGKGSGRLAEVDTANRIGVSSISSDRAESANLSREAFILSTTIQSIGAAAEHKTVYISNGEASRDIIIDIEKISFDGGSTSNTKPLTAKLYLNASIPTANNVAKDPIGLNTETGQSSTILEVWDDVSTGFVQTSPGDLFWTSILGLGLNDNIIPSKIILGPAKTLTYSFECAEAAKVSLQVFIHLS